MVVANLLYAVGEFLGCRTLLHIAYYKMGGDVGIHIGEGERVEYMFERAYAVHMAVNVDIAVLRTAAEGNLLHRRA